MQGVKATIEIPEVFKNFPDNFVLDSRDILAMSSFSHVTGISFASRNGSFPEPFGTRNNTHGRRKLTWTLGQLREYQKNQGAN